MISKPEYLKFVEVEGTGKTRRVEVRSGFSSVTLGTIAWYSRWRQYTFWPERNTTFNRTCMEEISERLSKMTKDHFAAVRERRESAPDIY